MTLITRKWTGENPENLGEGFRLFANFWRIKKPNSSMQQDFRMHDALVSRSTPCPPAHTHTHTFSVCRKMTLKVTVRYFLLCFVTTAILGCVPTATDWKPPRPEVSPPYRQCRLWVYQDQKQVNDSCVPQWGGCDLFLTGKHLFAKAGNATCKKGDSQQFLPKSLISFVKEFEESASTAVFQYFTKHLVKNIQQNSCEYPRDVYRMQQY